MPEHMQEALDLVEKAVDIVQQLRYGNIEQARIKTIELAASATDLYMNMNMPLMMPLTASSEERDGETDP